MPNILTINAGSSSIRFAFFAAGRRAVRKLEGKLERIGGAGANMWAGRPGEPPKQVKIDAANAGSAIEALLQWLETQSSFAPPDAIGHRVVHGMLHTAPERVTALLLDELASDDVRMIREHLPREIELIEVLKRRYPDVPQVVCFDTAFHRTMPSVATLLPIPRRYAAKGVQRYGFHGLSYTFLMQELARLGDPAAARGRVILAHLGSGASLAAVLARPLH